MTLYFPDLNVWLGLSDGGHPHNAMARAWVSGLEPNDLILFSRYTQIGLLRLLTNAAVMGDRTLTLGQAWVVYDSWIAHPRVEFRTDPHLWTRAFVWLPSHLHPRPHRSGSAIAGCWRLRERLNLIS